MSTRNVVALLSHVGRSELLPRWQSEEVDDDLLGDIDLENFKILGLTDQQARAAVAFKTNGFRMQPPPSVALAGSYGRVTSLLNYIGRLELLSGDCAFAFYFILHLSILLLQLFRPRKLTMTFYPTSTTAISFPLG